MKHKKAAVHLMEKSHYNSHTGSSNKALSSDFTGNESIRGIFKWKHTQKR